MYISVSELSAPLVNARATEKYLVLCDRIRIKINELGLVFVIIEFFFTRTTSFSRVLVAVNSPALDLLLMDCPAGIKVDATFRCSVPSTINQSSDRIHFQVQKEIELC
jgi:hypothetical protein